MLSRLARQRVAIVMQPGGVWVTENALQRSDAVEASSLPPFTRTETIYRLTEGGWAALNRAHAWTLAGVLIAVLPLIATIVVAS